MFCRIALNDQEVVRKFTIYISHCLQTMPLSLCPIWRVHILLERVLYAQQPPWIHFRFRFTPHSMDPFMLQFEATATVLIWVLVSIQHFRIIIISPVQSMEKYFVSDTHTYLHTKFLRRKNISKYLYRKLTKCTRLFTNVEIICWEAEHSKQTQPRSTRVYFLSRNKKKPLCAKKIVLTTPAAQNWPI